MVQRKLTFDLACHSSDAVQRALYRFSDRLTGQVSVRDGTVDCIVEIDVNDQQEADRVVGDLRNEVLDQALRERIRAETAEERNLILALAFSDSGLVTPEAPRE